MTTLYMIGLSTGLSMDALALAVFAAIRGPGGGKRPMIQVVGILALSSCLAFLLGVVLRSRYLQFAAVAPSNAVFAGVLFAMGAYSVAASFRQKHGEGHRVTSNGLFVFSCLVVNLDVAVCGITLNLAPAETWMFFSVLALMTALLSSVGWLMGVTGRDAIRGEPTRFGGCILMGIAARQLLG